MLSRRQFVAGAGSSAAAVVLAPQALADGLTSARRAPLLRAGRFREGVMSGDPAPRAITLWTRLDDVERSGSVRLEVARDRGFRRVVASQKIGTSERMGGSVKARVAGLRPHEQYYYRFETARNESPVGRFRTALPADSEQPVRFAFFSCQDFTHGYYNAHEVLAEEDIDFVVCLGDYIYAEAYHEKGKTGVRNDPVKFSKTLQEYRDKYALYRSDKALRKVQGNFPMVTIWDDHEVQDNYAGQEDDGGLPANLAFSRRRQRRAYQAFFESMPTYGGGRSGTRIYRGLKFGKTVDLLMLDQRQYRADQPCNDAVAPPCADYDQPREFLGSTQREWLKKRLGSSNAAWKVIGNEVLITPARVVGGSFFTFDGWYGYPREREEILQHIKSKGIKDVVFVTGDIHIFIAGDVRTQLGAGESVALEFVGGSITSQNLGETTIDAGGGVTIPGNDANPKTPQGLIDALRGFNPGVDNAEFDHHGYGLVKATMDEFDVTLKRIETIKRRSTALLPDQGFRWTVKRGQTSIKGVNGPA